MLSSRIQEGTNNYFKLHFTWSLFQIALQLKSDVFIASGVDAALIVSNLEIRLRLKILTTIMKVLDTLKKYLNDIEGTLDQLKRHFENWTLSYFLGQVQELQEPEGTEPPGPVETKVFKRRWYILALYSLLCCHQVRNLQIESN